MSSENQRLEWKSIIDFPGYKVSSNGLVSGPRKARLKQSICYGYHTVCLKNTDKKITAYVHRLVANAFISNPHNKPIVDHIDGDCRNNHVKNLRWTTQSENRRNTHTEGIPTSLYQGVCYHRQSGKWRATILNDGKRLHIGYFKNEDDAALAYNNIAKRLYCDMQDIKIKYNVINNRNNDTISHEVIETKIN